MFQKIEDRQTFNIAKDLFDLAITHPQISFSVIDDGCYERAEAIVALGMINNIDPNLLSRVFLINRSDDSFIEANKPLAINGELQKWFNDQLQNDRLQPGSFFKVEDKTYFVDNYGALRASDLPTVYLDSNPTAYWGVGHVAPMVGNFILDPAVDSQPISYWDWKERIETDSILPVKASVNSLPDIDFDLLNMSEIETVMQFLDTNIKIYANTNFEDYISLCKQSYAELSEDQKSKLFGKLFKKQLDEHSLLPKNLWSELSITPLTTRGEKFDEITKDIRNHLNTQLVSSSWEERLELAIDAMSPFKAFENLIRGAEFSWLKKT